MTITKIKISRPIDAETPSLGTIEIEAQVCIAADNGPALAEAAVKAENLAEVAAVSAHEGYIERAMP